MTLVSDIINSAYRESNTIPLGRPATVLQTTEALQLYNGILSTVFGGDAGELLVDWPLGNFDRETPGYNLPYTNDTLINPQSNSRLIAVNLTPLTVYLTSQPQDGALYGIADPFGRLATVPITLDANGRIIEGNPTLLLNVNGAFREWMYRADLGAWTKVNSVLTTDDNPFPSKYDNMFIILLAMRINPRYGRTLDQQSVMILKQNKREFIARYLQSLPLQPDDSISWPFMSRQSYNTQQTFSSQQSFNLGYRR